MDVSAAEQQPPTHSPDQVSIQSLVRSDLEQREQLGVERYGTALQANNGRSGIVDAYQEALDLTCYLRQVIEEGGLVGRHGADDTPDDPFVQTTPGRLLARILDGSTEQRLDICGRLLSVSATGHDCFMADHVGRIKQLSDKVAELSRSLIKCASGKVPDQETIASAQWYAQENTL